eukprot:4225837-Alexandrium_andersonii.AAC.1
MGESFLKERCGEPFPGSPRCCVKTPAPIAQRPSGMSFCGREAHELFTCLCTELYELHVPWAEQADPKQGPNIKLR